MIWPSTRKKINALKQAVSEDDIESVRALLTHDFPIHLAVGGEDCVVRVAMRNENVAILAALISAGARPPKEAACYMALWIERVARCQGVRRENIARRTSRARLAMRLLAQAGVDWDQTSSSLGNGDTARFVINHVWPGSLQPSGT